MNRTIAAVAFAAVFVCAANADLFSPDRPLETLETEYFTFIFPLESEPAIEYLASFADGAYREIASLLGTTPKHRIPVVMTPDSEELSGYFTWQPYLRIVLYQAPIDPNSTLGCYDDDLRKLFYHELTHAVSMTVRSGFEDALVAIFGSPLGVSTYLSPPTFVEGVTVSFESRDGFGRAADPLSGAYLRQDSVEGRWKTFAQASGAYDGYPYGALYYLYGGYFSRYLQARFGMEAYAGIWREFGAASVFRSLDDGLFGPGRFSKVFGISLSEAWDDFGESMKPRLPVIMATEPLARPSVVSAIAGNGDALYFADYHSETVYAMATGSREAPGEAPGEVKALFRAGAKVERLDVARDGSRILVSTVRYEAGFPRLVLKEWNAETGGLATLPAQKTRDAAYLPDGTGIIGISIDGYQTNVTLVRGDRSVVLLRGTERIGYASPVVSADGETAYVLAKEGGKVSVVRVGLEGTGISRLELPDSLSWVRYLSLGDDGVLRFSWDDESFYRLAELDGNTLSYQTVPLSGGVHRPVLAGGRVRYIGRFSEGMAPCSFPEDRGPLAFVEASVGWSDAGDLGTAASVYDYPSTRAYGRYSALGWLAPRFWLPVGSGDERGISTLGLLFFIADPAERLSATLGADWNLRASAVDVEVQADWSRFAFPVSLSVVDSFETYGTGSILRRSSALLGAGDAVPLFSGGTVSWSLDAGLAGYAISETGPYAAWSDAAATFAASLGLTDTTAPTADPEARTGYSISALARIGAPALPVVGPPSVGVEASARGFLEPAALAFSAYGAAAVVGGVRYGPRGQVSASGIELSKAYPAWVEFEDGTSGSWFAQGEASLRLLGLEAQAGLGPLYLNRLSIRMGARGYAAGEAAAVLDAGWSAFARASLTWTPVIGAFSKVHPVSYLEFWCRPDRASAGALPHGIAYMLVASY
ncbi:MAG: hypothetical protein KKA67_00860 [Spirochaetes bacterium]|nr:hypothetical protein [Spirochaetota bacterium]